MPPYSSGTMALVRPEFGGFAQHRYGHTGFLMLKGFQRGRYVGFQNSSASWRWPGVPV